MIPDDLIELAESHNLVIEQLRPTVIYIYEKNSTHVRYNPASNMPNFRTIKAARSYLESL